MIPSPVSISISSQRPPYTSATITQRHVLGGRTARRGSSAATPPPHASPPRKHSPVLVRAATTITCGREREFREGGRKEGTKPYDTTAAGELCCVDVDRLRLRLHRLQLLQGPIAMRMRASSSTGFKAIVASACWLAVLLGSASLAASNDAGFSPPPTAVPPGPPRPALRAVAAGLPPVPVSVPAPLPRKILRPPGVAGGEATAGGPVRPSRMDEGCAGAEDIAIYQGHASSLPGGVPAYKVDVINQCLGDLDGGDCAIAGIHVRCGWFSSVSLVDPRKFRRLGHDDCLLNDGRPLLGGETISFEYANSFPYQLSVRVATCVDPTTTP